MEAQTSGDWRDTQVTVIVAAGNSAVDSCLMSPGNVNGTLNVAASDLGPQKFNGPQSDATDSIYQYSNTGSCVDLFAPGTNILAACGGAGGWCPALLSTAMTKCKQLIVASDKTCSAYPF